jgi:hypothetical protein
MVSNGNTGNKLCANDFSSNQVWPKLIILAESEWVNTLNEQYLNDLLTRFDSDLLQFNINGSSSGINTGGVKPNRRQESLKLLMHENN